MILFYDKNMVMRRLIRFLYPFSFPNHNFVKNRRVVRTKLRQLVTQNKQIGKNVIVRLNGGNGFSRWLELSTVLLAVIQLAEVQTSHM